MKIEKLHIGGKYIGEGENAFIVAEIGQNHNGDMEIATRLIDQAHQDGVDAVKFCKRHIKSGLTKAKYDSLYPSKNSFGRTYGEHREFLEFSRDQHRELKEYAQDKGLIYFASVCDIISADELDALGMPMFKIASRDLTNKPLIEHIAKKQKPIFLSTGMSNLADISRTIALIRKYHNQILLFQCTSEYPTRYEDINLNAISSLRNQFGLNVGISDHAGGIMSACAAVAMGAPAVEKHITLSRDMKGTDHQAALEPPGMERLVGWVRNFEKAKGSGIKSMYSGEFTAKKKLVRSIVAASNLSTGDVVAPEMLAAKSHVELGLNPFEDEKLLGRTLIKDIKKDELITLEDVK
jgi:sialic acid synthase SpsE